MFSRSQKQSPKGVPFYFPSSSVNSSPGPIRFPTPPSHSQPKPGSFPETASLNMKPSGPPIPFPTGIFPTLLDPSTDGPPKKKRPIGYLNPHQWLPKITHENIPLTQCDRLSTKPPTIDEDEYEELEKKIKAALTPEMREAARNRDFETRDKTLLHKILPPLEPGWNPYERMDLTKCLYPKKKVPIKDIQDFNEYYSRYPDLDSEYVVQTSTKLVRNHNSIAVEKRKIAQVANSNMTWTRDNAEQIATNTPVVIDGSFPTLTEPEVVIQLQESIMVSGNPSPAGSPNRVFVECAVPTPVNAFQTRPNRPKPFNKSDYSLRVINGQRITGDSKECYSYLKNSCNLGIFCRYEHNGSTQHGQTKVCHRLLRGLCRPDNEECPSEHAALLPHQYPNCVFFLRGDCTAGEKCTLLHVKHSNRVPPCSEFLRGKCTKGAECDNPHCYPWQITKEKGTSEYARKETNTQEDEQNAKLSAPRTRRVYFRQEEPHLVEEAHQMQMEGEPNEVIVGEEEVHEEIVDDEKLDPGTMDDVNNGSWQPMLPAKRPYSEEEVLEDDIVHYSPGYQRIIPGEPRRRGRPKKFPSGAIPPHYLSRMQDKTMDNQLQDLDYEEEPPQQQPQQSQSARVVTMAARVVEPRMYQRGSTPMLAAQRMSQPGPLRMPTIGQAAHLASQRLPQLGGGPPKENKPLKVVTLLPNSRRQGAGPPRPLVSSVRPLGRQVANKIPQLSIEKQAEMIINQTVKQADRIPNGQTIGEINKVVEMLNNQILSLQEDNKRLNQMYTGLIDFKDNRIKQLETQVEKLQNELGLLSKTWHANLFLQAIADSMESKQEMQPSNSHQVGNSRGDRLSQVTTRTVNEWIITDGTLQTDTNGEIHQEIIEEEVDEETFLRMQHEMRGEHEIVIRQDVEEIPEEEVVTSVQMGQDKHQMA